MGYEYDNQNVFAKILRGEIPNDTVHVLVIPKGPYVCYDHFANAASEAEIVDFTRAVGEVCRIEGVEPGAGGGGFRAIANAGENGVQEVPHFHLHILGGRNMGRMIAQS